MFRCTKEEVLWKRKTSSFFVAFGSLWKGLEQPVRPPCVPAHKKQRACAFRKPSPLLPFRHRAPFGDCPRQKNAPGPPELGTGRAGGFAVFH